MLCHQGHHVHTWKIIHHDPREHWLHGSKLKAIFPEPSPLGTQVGTLLPCTGNILLSFTKFSEFNVFNILYASELTVYSDFTFAMAADFP
jgi:hypothetical protein